MRKLVALPVLSADALSSVAYGPRAMLAVLVLADLAGLSYSLPVGAAIAFPMLAVGVSYRQTIRARSFLRIDDRLTFRNGILLLSVTSATIYIVFRGNTESLLPLYAVGVFLAFTPSQTGMIMHWRRHRDQPHWRHSLAFNATGAVLSGIVFVIEGVTKFTAGS